MRLWRQLLIFAPEPVILEAVKKIEYRQRHRDRLRERQAGMKERSP